MFVMLVWGPSCSILNQKSSQINQKLLLNVDSHLNNFFIKFPYVQGKREETSCTGWMEKGGGKSKVEMKG